MDDDIIFGIFVLVMIALMVICLLDSVGIINFAFLDKKIF